VVFSPVLYVAIRTIFPGSKRRDHFPTPTTDTGGGNA
jgi:hypothetical protein